MNTWLLGACAALLLIGATHSVMGERRIFLPWASAPPSGLAPVHRVLLRASWHLPTLLSAGMAAVLYLLAGADVGGPWRSVLGTLALAVGACGTLVAGATRGRHHGGTALLATAVLIVLGQWQGSAA